MSRSGYWRAPRKPWEALFPGICGICAQPFAIGDPIKPIRGKHRDGYAHFNCGDDE